MEILYVLGIVLLLIAIPSTYYEVKHKQQLGLYKKAKLISQKQKQRSDFISWLLVGMGSYCIFWIVVTNIFHQQIPEPYLMTIAFSMLGCVLVALPLVYTKKYWDTTDENYIHKTNSESSNP